MNPPTLTDAELATVLAALRHWQDASERKQASFPHFAEVKRLTRYQVDNLCERLNTVEQVTV